MIVYDHPKKQLKIEIKISSIKELYNYQKGIRGLLRKIEIGSCDAELKENIKTVYELLSHLQPDQSLLSKIEGSLRELNQTMSKN